MIFGICSGPVYITLNLFIIVLETCSMLVAMSRSDKYIPTMQHPACRLSRAPKTVLLSEVGMNNFSDVWIENLSNFKHFHISAMSNNRITAHYEFL